MLDLRLSRFANMDETLSRRFDLRQKQHPADCFHSAPPVYIKFRLQTHFGSPFNGDGYENNSAFLRMFQDVGKAPFLPLFAQRTGWAPTKKPEPGVRPIEKRQKSRHAKPPTG
ncbi:hypothetical protein [Methylocystis rosea]|uniref:hypothetical protein n=1 Tax=Methylocystis rosea TaxID=173366 RepID=UPI0012B1E931|nr:hypothetical protein [Methylocystis rosea]